MRKLTLVLAILFAMAQASPAFAKNQQIAFGGARTADTAISGGQSITGISLVCGGTACVASIADIDTLGGMTNANTVWEGGAAANASLFIDLTDSPIVTTTGATINLDANVTAIVLYTTQVNP